MFNGYVTHSLDHIFIIHLVMGVRITMLIVSVFPNIVAIKAMVG